MNFKITNYANNDSLKYRARAFVPTCVISLFYIFILILPASASINNKACQNFFIIDYLFCSLNDILSYQPRHSLLSTSIINKKRSDHLMKNRDTQFICSDITYSDARNPMHYHSPKNKRRLSTSSSNGYSTYRNFNSKACVRSGPGTEYDIINTYRYKDVPDYLTIYSTEDGWQLIGIPEDGTLGWIKTFSVPGDRVLARQRMRTVSRQRFQRRHSKTDSSGNNASYVSQINEGIAHDEQKEFSEEIINDSRLKFPSFSKFEKNHNEEEYSSQQISDINTSHASLTSFASFIPHYFDLNISIGQRDINLPYFIAHRSDETLPGINYIVIYDDLIYNNSSFPRINEDTFDKNSGSTIMASNPLGSSILEKKMFNLESGIANFDKFIITDDGHIHVSAGISDQFNTYMPDSDKNGFVNSPLQKMQSWAYMPLILASHINAEDQTSSGFYRVRNIKRSGTYSNCTHTVTDGLKGSSSTTKSEFIVGNAEICFDNSGKKARVSYGYELWVRLSPTNSNICLSINRDRNLCRVSDSRLKPLISFWTISN